MSYPPSSDPTAGSAVAQVTALAGALAGALRRDSVLDLLIRHIRGALSPAEVHVALPGDSGGGGGFTRQWPDAAPNRSAMLQAAAEHGPLLHADEWLLVPLVVKGRVAGAAAVRGESDRYGPADLALLEAFVATAAVALESARLIDLQDDGRRSWQDVVDAIPLALCTIDGSGRIRQANRAFAELVGAPPASLIRRPWQSFVPPEWTPELQQVLHQQGAGREVELRTGDRAYAVTVVPLSRTDRSTVVLLFDDQTERRRLQDQLLQSEKMSAIGQLIAGVAHDLNNPLASVVGFADYLGEVRDIPPVLHEPLTVIREEAERASNIVKNLLSFARKQEHQRRPTPIGPLLDATFVLLRNQLMATRVEAAIEIEPDLPAPNVDANQLQQVFVNLINNAAQAIATTGRPGRIVVRARRWMDGIAVDVIDDGPGMSEQLAAQVFEPFFTTKPEGEGTGLGLSISQGIVKEHGGRITLVSDEGKGSTFTVQLPLGAPPVPARSEVGGRAPQRSLRVLVVDDEPHILHYMRATLEAWGHTVSSAGDGDEALDLVARQPFDLIISDLRMPRLGGREFYEAMAARNPAMAPRIVFSTGDTVRGDTLAFLERLGRPYLHKPFSLSELRSLLSRVARDSDPHLARSSGAHPVDVLRGA